MVVGPASWKLLRMKLQRNCRHQSIITGSRNFLSRIKSFTNHKLSSVKCRFYCGTLVCGALPNTFVKNWDNFLETNVYWLVPTFPMEVLHGNHDRMEAPGPNLVKSRDRLADPTIVLSEFMWFSYPHATWLEASTKRLVIPGMHLIRNNVTGHQLGLRYRPSPWFYVTGHQHGLGYRPSAWYATHHYHGLRSKSPGPLFTKW